ncbi:F0F1 ATP synthase subunit delta [Cellulomonas bogoriensis]|uniref:ATP synthase subunit delta n=1 Tax=Cellulomonas bogoriensis 69B4 = DSM 16987 TaxID=1386082 RepID=A0A0A0BZH4_9CELL|nr:F0F1 ATP synthase subunit delta [Cellulomonas bogoriensis]KGM13773.1 ATP synthase subunit delta [Cellulomonas bogoriensis 69B4 = DSM 16987]
MRGTGQASLQAVAEGYEPVLRAAGSSAASLGRDLFAVVDALDGSSALRRALSDPARSGEDKSGLVAGLLAGKVDDRVVAVVSALVRARWSAEADLVQAVELLATDSVLAAADHDGALAQVEDELFRIDRVLAGERALRQALTDRSAEPSRRAALVRQVFGEQAHPLTVELLERVARAPRGRSITAALAHLGRLTAERRRRLVAKVTAATVLTEAQRARLVALLERTYERPVQLNVSVDPAVIGGLRIEVGSEVVDATVLGRLDDARRRLAG